MVVLTPTEDFQDYNHEVYQEDLPTISQIHPPAGYSNLDFEVQKSVDLSSLQEGEELKSVQEEPINNYYWEV